MVLKPEVEGEGRLLAPRDSRSECLLGNEAIVRGALEAGVAFASGYPGTPSSEVTDTFARIAASMGIVFEYSVNEKVALEMAFSASLAGARSICAMKHLGLMVAGDPLSTIPYIGVEAGMVIVSAGDPGCGTSPNEQDQRLLGPMLHIPILDPSTPQDAHDMTRFAFELSEGCRLPVILRATTHVCHTRAEVEFGPPVEPRTGDFVRDPGRYVPIPANARRMRLELKDRMDRAREMLASSEFFGCEGEGPDVILASGAPAATCADLIEEYDLSDRVSLWTLGIVHPLPEGKILERLRGVERLLVVEELNPFLEDALQLLCARRNLDIEILGKHTGHLPFQFNYTPPVIRKAMREGLGLGPPIEEGEERPLPVPPRPPALCPGCTHRAAFFAARTAFDDDQLYFNDIGCYTLGYGPPLETADALLCMGAGITLAAGVSRMTGRRTVGFVGDSTFFHAGIPPLLNAIKEGDNMVAVILDNQVTAMTGFQESAGRVPGHLVSIERVVRALGAEHVEKVDPFDTPEAVAAFHRAREAEGVSVVIVEHGCAAHEARRKTSSREKKVYEVDPERCRACGQEKAGLRCSQVTTLGYERQLSRGRIARAGSYYPDVAPCSRHCPLSLCIEGYIGHIAAGEYAEAFGHIMSRTPLPGTVCRVCHAPCEEVCVRGTTDGSLAINALKRFAVDWAYRQEEDPYPPPREEENGMRVAVIGAGPSGLSAAYDLRLRGYGVKVFDAAERPGGLLSHGIPGYRLPPEVLERDVDRLLGLGIEFEGGCRLGRDIHLEALLGGEFDAVYLALGAGRALTIDLPGSGAGDVPPMVTALAYLEKAVVGSDVETGRRVVVVGGGNAAIDAARTALRRGAESVCVVCLERFEEMPAIRGEIIAAREEGIEIYNGMRPSRLRAGGIAFVPAAGEGREGVDLGADLVIVAIGQVPDIEGVVPDGLAFERTPDGYLRIDPETHATSYPGIFAGGDLARREQTVTDAMASGLRAAWGIDATLRGRSLADHRAPPRIRPAFTEGEGPLAIPDWSRTGRLSPEELQPTIRGRNFEEVVRGLDEEEARSEAARCLMCGHCGNCRLCVELFGCPAIQEDDASRIVVDPFLCTGCGVCAELCPNGAFRVVAHVG